MTVRSPLIQAGERQAAASRPDASAWVSANAGSGKTFVLVNRIIRLLLARAKPERILCLTFTRAAAAEMEARLFRRLSGWIAQTDDELRSVIQDITRKPAGKDDLATARRLFTRALETPGGLKIQTLHGFCESVLQRFPVEAGLAPGFTILDERASSELMAEARNFVLQQAARDIAYSAEGRSLRHITSQVRAPGFDDVLFSLLRQRSEHVLRWQRQDVSEALKTALFGELGLAPTDTPDAIVENALACIDRTACDAAIEAFSESKAVSDVQKLECLTAGLSGSDWHSYRLAFLTKEEKPRKEGGLATKGVKEKHPEVLDWLVAEQARVVAAEDRRKAAETALASDALFTIASVILQRFEALKARRGQLDYDDLVHHTQSLLTRLDSAWVLYRLDGGIDHVLIDEAQDTSPAQWEIVRQLTAEFFSGEGAREGTRTVFAVGDHKQSIFSFQGAEPDRFLQEKDDLARRAGAADAAFEDVRINISFRSTQRVLDIVDRVFQNPMARRGMAEPEIDHIANRERQAGLVELWPLFEREEVEERDPYDPVDAPARSDPRIRLARHVAATIRGWLDSGEELIPRGRPVKPGDILILVRNRTVLADALVRFLREAGIPVAGADRLTVNSHIAVMDLVALARVMHLPQDDYSLACVLKSPIVERPEGGALDDDDLTDLCATRDGTLWQALASSGRFANVGSELARMRRLARYSQPYEFFSEVLEGGGARKRFAARLGPEVHDVLDEFLALALDFEQTHPPALHGFISWLGEGDTEIKRDMDQGRNEVRVMTVHGAKGLEANVVILPDTTRLPDKGKTPPVLKFASGVPVWKLGSERQPDAVVRLGEAYLERRMEEENRLLYVAMTRARDRLYVAGAEGRSSPRAECWYELVRSALETVGEDVGGGVIRWSANQEAAVRDDEEGTSVAIQAERPEPWMLRQAPSEPAEPKPLSPSRLDLEFGEGGVTARLAEQPAASPLSGADESRFLRGQLIHQLLQSLPDLDADQRARAARHFVDLRGGELGDSARDGVIDEVLQLLNSPDPVLSALFEKGGLSEVPVTGKIDLAHATGAPVVVSGVIDRLVVKEDEVLLADYKTNRPPPASAGDVAAVYIRQLAAYRAVLNSIYPGRNVRAWLVWTYNAHAMEIPADLMDGAFT